MLVPIVYGKQLHDFGLVRRPVHARYGSRVDDSPAFGDFIEQRLGEAHQPEHIHPHHSLSPEVGGNPSIVEQHMHRPGDVGRGSIHRIGIAHVAVDVAAHRPARLLDVEPDDLVRPQPRQQLHQRLPHPRVTTRNDNTLTLIAHRICHLSASLFFGVYISINFSF